MANRVRPTFPYRYMNQLRPDINNGPFALHEDTIILQVWNKAAFAGVIGGREYTDWGEGTQCLFQGIRLDGSGQSGLNTVNHCHKPHTLIERFQGHSITAMLALHFPMTVQICSLSHPTLVCILITYTFAAWSVTA